MGDKAYFSQLYEIASQLNKEFSLPAALQQALAKTVELFDLETGWIWLVQQDGRSVYLAASYNLPPALGNHPERLSGWCYCISKYLSDDIGEATNISEITCTRLRDLTSGTRNLKFHATVPVITNGRKVGLINLVSRETQQLDEEKLSVLNTIGELTGMAIRRTRLQESYVTRNNDVIPAVLERVLQPGLESLLNLVRDSVVLSRRGDFSPVTGKLDEMQEKTEELQRQLSVILRDSRPEIEKGEKEFRYPASPLTARELEVLTLARKGHTNMQIADRLHISERTVKFHISSILSKLFAKTRSEAIDIALQRGLLGL
jgi:two-component system, NarL family, sensor kinase